MIIPDHCALKKASLILWNVHWRLSKPSQRETNNVSAIYFVASEYVGFYVFSINFPGKNTFTSR
jgi:hypothetical protein